MDKPIDAGSLDGRISDLKRRMDKARWEAECVSAASGVFSDRSFLAAWERWREAEREYKAALDSPIASDK